LGRPRKGEKRPSQQTMKDQPFKLIEARLLKETGQTLEQLNQRNIGTYYADELLDLINGADPESLGLNPGEFACLKRNNLLTLHNLITENAKRLLTEIGRLPG